MTPSFATRWNLDALEAAYQRWRHDPDSVDESWRHFFEGFELGASRTALPALDARAQTGIEPAIRLAQNARSHTLTTSIAPGVRLTRQEWDRLRPSGSEAPVRAVAVAGFIPFIPQGWPATALKRMKGMKRNPALGPPLPGNRGPTRGKSSPLFV